MTGINFVTTILKVRAPGMTYMRMPIFCWTALAANLLIIAAFPVLTATLAMLILDRYLGFHFFTNEAGGNMMMFINLIWAWGHPEVYILVLPAFGIFSEVIPTFSGKPVFGYRSMVAATLFICLVSFMVWLHHFFTMGAGGDVNAVFGIATSIIAVGTGVKVYNWMFTMYGGRIRYATPMLWSVGFIVTFIIGGMTGVLLAVPPADFQLHNSLFLVAHFHNVIIGGVLFAGFAGITYWFPKAFGFRLHEGWGKVAFWCALIGFYVTFIPLYVAGLLGMTRRLQHYEVAAWRPWVLIAGLGVIILLIGAIAQVIQLDGQYSPARRLARRNRRSLGRPLARMGDRIAPARLQFRSAAECGRGGALLADQAAGHRAAAIGAGADLRGDRGTPQQPGRIHHRLLRDHHRLRVDLAHLVAGRRRRGGGLCGLRLVRLAGCDGIRNTGGRSCADRSRPPCRAPAMA